MSRNSIGELAQRLLGAVQSGGYMQGFLAGVGIVINPTAGKLAHRGLVRATVREMACLGFPLGDVSDPHAEIVYTEYHGHGYELGKRIGKERSETRCVARQTACRPWLLLTVGGDGTHEEVLSGLLDSSGDPVGLRIVRFAMGSGNDAASVHRVDELLAVLHGAAESALLPVVEVRPSEGRPIYSFNVASFGLDAYIVKWSNRLKRSRFFPGSSYTLVANFLSLVYRPPRRKEYVCVELESQQGEYSRISGDIVLLAVGASGYRRYGRGKRVLPGAENLCAVTNMSLPQRIPLRKLFYAGEHVRHPKVEMFSVRVLTVHSDQSLYFQADGEARLLEAEQFPVRVCVHSTSIVHLTAGPYRVQT